MLGLYIHYRFSLGPFLRSLRVYSSLLSYVVETCAGRPLHSLTHPAPRQPVPIPAPFPRYHFCSLQFP
jgi:hypothetical protein